MAGKIIVAVSGGIDSMALLDMMVKQASRQFLIVAHVDHGIRSDSHDDAVFVEQAAYHYKLPFATTKLQLQPGVSEEAARQARYAWLSQIRRDYGAVSVVTAHHQDDVIETIFLNLIRGTGWRGLASIRNKETLRRPLLNMSKAEIIEYALKHNLKWHDDSTNQDVRLTRNYIRHLLVPRLTAKQRTALIALWRSQCTLREQIESVLAEVYTAAKNDDGLSRYWLVMSDPKVQDEVVQLWLGRSLQRATLERLRHFIATARNGAICPVEGDLRLSLEHNRLVVKP